MKLRLKRAVLLLSGILTGCQLFAQSTDSNQPTTAFSLNNYRTWSVGISGGISTPYTLLGYNSRQDFTSPDVKFGYDFYVKDQLSHGFGLQADLFMGNLRGDHAQERYANGAYIYAGFDTKVNWAASLSGNFTIAHIYNKRHQGVVEPYLSLGVGVMNYTTTLRQYLKSPTYLPASSGVLLPVGAGFKFNVTSNINIDFGYQVNFAGDDRFDGYTYGPTTDRFSYTHLGLEFVLGKRSKPEIVRTSRLAEVEMRDRARETALQTSLQEQRDELDQEKAKNVKLSNDLASANNMLNKYTVDSDGDGVPDIIDKCPNTPAGTQVDGSGCPLVGNKPEGARAELTLDDWRIVTNTMRTLEFYPGTAVISESSFDDLNKLVDLLMTKKQSVKIEVYVAGTGKADNELKLSKDRAEAIKGYLAHKGVDAATIQAYGFGSAKPIASNKTPRGRKINERVILGLF
jgi:OOP family OmpA-OmpF porin